jgi:hypothetical protein
VADLVDAARRLHEAAASAGRPRPTCSVAVDALTIDQEPDPALADCPYVLGGSPARIAETVAARAAAIGLDALVLPESADLDVVVDALRAS